MLSPVAVERRDGAKPCELAQNTLWIMARPRVGPIEELQLSGTEVPSDVLNQP